MAYILWDEARERVVVLFFYIYRFETLRLDKLGKKTLKRYLTYAPCKRTQQRRS